MPTYKITDPETGAMLRVTGDSPPSETEIEQLFASQQPANQDKSLFDLPAAAAQQAGSFLTGALAQIPSGIAGVAALPFVGGEKAGQVVRDVQEAMTFKPTIEGAKQGAEIIGEKAAPISKAAEFIPKTLGDFTLDLTGSPAAAAAAYSAPTLALEMIGLKGLQNIRKGTRLIDQSGRPTKRLRIELDKRGLDYDLLSPEAKNAIPPVASPEMLPGANLPAKASEKALVEQIKSGARDDALASLRVVDGRVSVDGLGKEAVKQGFEPGLVQSVKTSSKATKLKMRKMTDMMRKIKKSSRKGLEFRPSDVVGGAVTSRIKFIRDNADAARKELNLIAATKLRGKSIDISPVTKKLQESLSDLDVSLEDTASGIPKPVFKGSLISKDKTSKRIIKDLVDLLGEDVAPDALRAHKLKKQLDIMIDFNKKSSAGLTDAGKKVLKDIRKELNNSVRAVDPNYARVNDNLSSSLNALNSLDESIGTIDMFGKGADKALGTRMRSLLSNQANRVKMENAIDSIDDLASGLGGKFDDNVKDLVMFSDALDSRFGTPAKTSLSGQMEQATRQVMDQGVSKTAYQKAGETIGRGAEKLRGINDFNAFESMQRLLNGK